MKLLDEDTARGTIQKQYAALWKDADQVWATADGLINEGELAPKVEPRLRWVMAGIYCKQLRLARSICLLLEHGLDQEAKVPLRCLFEMYLHLKFITQAKDQVKMARWFLMWESSANTPMINALAQHGSSQKDWKRLKTLYDDGLAKFREADIEEIRFGRFVRCMVSNRAIRRLLNALGIKHFDIATKRWKNYVHHGPSMMATEEMAKKLGLLEAYNYLYRDCSAAIHSYDVYSYVQPGEDTFGLRKPATDEWFEIIIKTAMLTLVDSIDIVDKILELSQADKIADLRKLEIFKLDNPPIP